MILQKQKVSKYKDKTYYKYSILVPEKDIIKLGWDKGTKLVGTIVSNKGYFITSK